MLEVPAGEIQIGRDPTNTVVLANPLVSRRHAIVRAAEPPQPFAHGHVAVAIVRRLRLRVPRQQPRGDKPARAGDCKQRRKRDERRTLRCAVLQRQAS